MKKIYVFLMTMILLLGLSVSGHATLIDRGGGLIYDTDLDITWLQDANYAVTSGYDADGLMTWDQAMTWVNNLSYGGYTGWRLPVTDPLDSTCGLAPGFGYNCTNSEMGHLFYTELGNLGYIAPDGTYPQPGWGLSNMGPFINMLPPSPPFVWWSNTEYTIGTAGGFNFVSGKQGAPNKEAELRAWAIRDGDVGPPDTDGDGISDSEDNCSTVANPDQTNTDLDANGDECDDDDDNDGICDVAGVGACTGGPDNCPTLANADQVDDLDHDNIGDACDADIDGDGICEGTNPIEGTCTVANDNCPRDSNPDQNDTDHDGLGDFCDSDDDNDSVLDGVDNCQFVVNADQFDLDGDHTGDACDTDIDGDNVPNISDNCPSVPNSDQNDLDVDLIGDACDPDIDGDDVANSNDLCAGTPLNSVVAPGNGCSVAQLCPCNGPRGTTVPWQNHGKYVSCLTHTTGDFVAARLITEEEKDATVSTAGQSMCGGKK